MELKLIYNNTTLILIALFYVIVLVGPSTVSSLIAKEKGYRFVSFVYFFYSFMFLPVIATFVLVLLSGEVRYLVSAIIIPIAALVPVWHARNLKMNEDLQHASQVQGVRLKSCHYCDEPFEYNNIFCPFCHHRTPLSLMTDWRVVLFVLSIITFILALFMASDEYLYDLRSYNMLAPFLLAAELVPFVAVEKSSVLFFVFLILIIAGLSCFLYTIGSIIYTANCLVMGKTVQRPAVLFIVALYITVMHPMVFGAISLINNKEPITLDFSPGWIFWVISYIFLCLSLYYLRTEDNPKNDSNTYTMTRQP
ncbi:hypothetical protein [Halodesulfovibrio aestuarii]|uniref:Zinc ribbon domain-containing protein n=1 Tax=Halodesulfovibrio aestuarii TaxID=126333 RepID=A0ABV4JQ84_9BACT